MKSLVALGCFAVGVVVLLLSFAASSMFDARSSLGDDAMNKLLDLQSAKMNALFALEAGKANPRRVKKSVGELQADVDKLTAEVATLEAEFEAAKARPAKMAAIFRYSGLALLIAGVIANYAIKE